MIIEMSAEGTVLDAEDREVLARYGNGLITRDEMMTFFCNKAARIDEQMRRPQ